MHHRRPVFLDQTQFFIMNLRDIEEGHPQEQQNGHEAEEYERRPVREMVAAIEADEARNHSIDGEYQVILPEPVHDRSLSTKQSAVIDGISKDQSNFATASALFEL